MKKPVKNAASSLGLGAIQRETLNDRIYQQLRTMIMSGRVRPGKELKLRELAKELHVSLMPVRDATVPEVVRQARQWLRPALWTTFAPEGVELLSKAIERGELP